MKKTKEKPLITPAQALEIITSIPVESARPIPVWLWDGAGRVLAEDIVTQRDIPPFNRAAMDGYAVRSVDLKEVPYSLEVIAIREAGDSSGVKIEPGQCVKIMTGAAVPDDADAIVMIEDSESDNPTAYTRILKCVEPYENIARRGEDAPAGSIVLGKGQWLSPAALATAAGVGRSMLSVYPAPLVSTIQTGGELVEPGNPVAENSIYNSNATLLAGMIDGTGIARHRYLGICPDDPEKLRAAINAGLNSDVLIITGGVSKGDFDYVPELLAKCDVKIQFHGLSIKPGKPLLFGSTHRGSFVFGLPGNPVSVMVCFYEFVLPLIRRLAGERKNVLAGDLRATTTETVKKKVGRTYYCCAGLSFADGELIAHPIPGHGSGDYTAAAQANGVIIIGAESSGAQKGEKVIAHLWQIPLEELNRAAPGAHVTPAETGGHSCK